MPNVVARLDDADYARLRALFGKMQRRGLVPPEDLEAWRRYVKVALLAGAREMERQAVAVEVQAFTARDPRAAP